MPRVTNAVDGNYNVRMRDSRPAGWAGWGGPGGGNATVVGFSGGVDRQITVGPTYPWGPPPGRVDRAWASVQYHNRGARRRSFGARVTGERAVRVSASDRGEKRGGGP